MGAGSGDADLAQYHWRKRVVLVFAPACDDTRLLAQDHVLAVASAGSRERDIVVIQAVGPSDLHHSFGIPAPDFAVVLLGKDGGEKWRQGTPATAEQIFAVIDAMPMRRAEAAR